MSREILFRGKRIDNGEWVEGDLIHDNVSGICIQQSYQNPILIHPVDPSTVCQYTGMKDRADKMIFENDIVRIAGHPDLRGWIRFGSYSDARGIASTNYGYFIDFIQNNDYYRRDFGFWIPRMIVIGNYFDNPELLEGGTSEDD